jgi:hypothetical protein
VEIQQRRELEDFVGDFLRAAHDLRAAGEAPQAVREVLMQRPESKKIAAEIGALPDEELLSILDDAEAMGLDCLLDDEEN